MIFTPNTQNLSFEDYLNYDDGTDNRYEFEDGKLVLMHPPTGRHALILRWLSKVFEAEIERLNLPWIPLQGIGIRTAVNRARIPDLCIVTRDQIQDYLEVSVVIESAALLAVEIVSPESKTRDYRFKRAEYSVAGISEYWIVDPTEQKVTILVLVEGLYEETIYQGDTKIVSPTFPELTLTTSQVFSSVV